METRVLKSSFSGIKGAKKERKLLEESSTSYLGAGCREFESRHSDQKCRNGLIPSLHFSFECETRTIKCGADERCRRQLDGGEPLSAPTGADANESRHLGRKRQFSVRKLAVLTFVHSDLFLVYSGASITLKFQVPVSGNRLLADGIHRP